MAVNITEDFKENDRQLDLEIETLRQEKNDLATRVSALESLLTGGRTVSGYISSDGVTYTGQAVEFEKGILK